jgi:ribosome maturation protein Sdo1
MDSASFPGSHVFLREDGSEFRRSAVDVEAIVESEGVRFFCQVEPSAAALSFSVKASTHDHLSEPYTVDELVLAGQAGKGLRARSQECELELGTATLHGIVSWLSDCGVIRYPASQRRRLNSLAS